MVVAMKHTIAEKYLIGPFYGPEFIMVLSSYADLA